MEKYRKTIIIYLVLIALISSFFYLSYKKVSGYKPVAEEKEMQVFGDRKAIKDFNKLFRNK